MTALRALLRKELASLFSSPTAYLTLTFVALITALIFFDHLRIPAESLIGVEGQGFRYILDGMNAERILLGAEALGDARWFLRKAVEYANQRVVFDAPIGRNQGIQFPIARAWAETEAADLMVRKAAALFDAGQPCGAGARRSSRCWRASSAPRPRGSSTAPTTISCRTRRSTWKAIAPPRARATSC